MVGNQYLLMQATVGASEPGIFRLKWQQSLKRHFYLPSKALSWRITLELLRVQAKNVYVTIPRVHIEEPGSIHY
jgi:hypothetical protein